MERASWSPLVRLGALGAFGVLALMLVRSFTLEGDRQDAAAPCEDYFGPATLDGPGCPSVEQNVVQVIPGKGGRFLVLCRCPRDGGSAQIRP